VLNAIVNHYHKVSGLYFLGGDLYADRLASGQVTVHIAASLMALVPNKDFFS